MDRYRFRILPEKSVIQLMMWVDVYVLSACLLGAALEWQTGKIGRDVQ